MATDVFHMDANGVRISIDRAGFGEHVYATRNITNVESIQDSGRRWPGKMMTVLGLGLAVVGFVMDSTIVMMMGGASVLSGSLNLSRKRPKFGIRITTQRGPVYVLASQDKRYVEVVATALRYAISAARRTTEQRHEPLALDESPSQQEPAEAEPHASHEPIAPRPRRRPSGRPTPPRRRRR